jgi:YHS domain-containing protein
MIRLIIWLLLIYIGYRVIRHLCAPKENPPDIDEGRKEPETTYLDPVCGLYVSEEDAVLGSLDGKRHYFCSMNCLEKFREQLDHKSS